MKIEVDEGLINEAVPKLCLMLEQAGLTEGIPEGMVSNAVEAGVRDYLTNAARDEAIDLMLMTKTSTHQVESFLTAKLQFLRQFQRKAAVSGTDQRRTHPALL